MQPVSVDLTLSLIQTATHWHDPQANQQLFEDWLAEAGDQSGVFSGTLSIDQLKTYRQTFPAWQDADEFSLDPKTDN